MSCKAEDLENVCVGCKHVDTDCINMSSNNCMVRWERARAENKVMSDYIESLKPLSPPDFKRYRAAMQALTQTSE